jgi:transcriptional regulator with XRE-family HTH domain
MGIETMINRVRKDRFYLTVGERLCALREAAGLTQRQLATQAGLSESTINNAESGINLSLLVATMVAEALDATLDELVPTEATS